VTDQPTDPATAAATIRRAATAMRDVANGVTTVWHDWTIEPPIGDFQWTIHDERGTHVVETPDYGGLELPDHIAAWPPPVALLVADVLDALADDITEALTDNDGRLFGKTPAEWTAAYNLAVAFLERRPTDG